MPPPPKRKGRSTKQRRVPSASTVVHTIAAGGLPTAAGTVVPSNLVSSGAPSAVPTMPLQVAALAVSPTVVASRSIAPPAVAVAAAPESTESLYSLSQASAGHIVWTSAPLQRVTRGLADGPLSVGARSYIGAPADAHASGGGCDGTSGLPAHLHELAALATPPAALALPGRVNNVVSSLRQLFPPCATTGGDTPVPSPSQAASPTPPPSSSGSNSIVLPPAPGATISAAAALSRASAAHPLQAAVLVARAASGNLLGSVVAAAGPAAGVTLPPGRPSTAQQTSSSHAPPAAAAVLLRRLLASRNGPAVVRAPAAAAEVLRRSTLSASAKAASLVAKAAAGGSVGVLAVRAPSHAAPKSGGHSSSSNSRNRNRSGGSKSAKPAQPAPSPLAESGDDVAMTGAGGVASASMRLVGGGMDAMVMGARGRPQRASAAAASALLASIASSTKLPLPVGGAGGERDAALDAALGGGIAGIMMRAHSSGGKGGGPLAPADDTATGGTAAGRRGGSGAGTASGFFEGFTLHGAALSGAAAPALLFDDDDDADGNAPATGGAAAAAGAGTALSGGGRSSGDDDASISPLLAGIPFTGGAEGSSSLLPAPIDADARVPAGNALESASAGGITLSELLQPGDATAGGGAASLPSAAMSSAIDTGGFPAPPGDAWAAAPQAIGAGSDLWNSFFDPAAVATPVANGATAAASADAGGPAADDSAPLESGAALANTSQILSPLARAELILPDAVLAAAPPPGAPPLVLPAAGGADAAASMLPPSSMAPNGVPRHRVGSFDVDDWAS